mgnify:CR=1 FL=1
MSRTDIRPVIKLKSTAGTGYTYVTRKNQRNDPDRPSIRKYDPASAGTSSSRKSADLAKKSRIVANERRKVIVERYAERREELRRASKDESLTREQRIAAGRALSKLPRDSAAIRVRNRDQVDGRPRGYLRQAGLSRIRFRQAAHDGQLPGITKSTW